MKTDILLSGFFFLLGLISGGIGVFLYMKRYFFYGDKEDVIDEAEERFSEPIIFPFTQIREIVKNQSEAYENLRNVPLNNNFENHELKSGNFKYAEKEVFKIALEAKLRKVTSSEEENYEYAAYLRDLIYKLDSWFPVRKKWFLSKIGYKLKPNSMNCDCDSCKFIVKNGVLVRSEQMALSMFAEENKRKIEDNSFFFQTIN